MRVRMLERGDVDAAMALCRAVFDEFEAPSHTQEGVEEFLDYINPAWIGAALAAGELILWGCFAGGDELAGVLCARPPRHISLLYVKGEYHRRGVARALVDEALAYLRGLGKTDHVTINPTAYAVEACRRLGFYDTGPEELLNGMRFVPMQTELGG